MAKKKTTSSKPTASPKTQSAGRSSSKSSSGNRAEPAPPFEESLDRLRGVVSELENGNLSLSDSLNKYEEGIANLRQCYQALNTAQRRIELLVDLDEEGNLVTRDFDNTASTEMTAGTRRGVSTASVNHDLEDEYDDEDEEDDDAGDDEDADRLF